MRREVFYSVAVFVNRIRIYFTPLALSSTAPYALGVLVAVALVAADSASRVVLNLKVGVVVAEARTTGERAKAG